MGALKIAHAAARITGRRGRDIADTYEQAFGESLWKEEMA
jgi:hypothetical protein